MKAFAAFAMRSPLNAGLVVACTLLLGLALPPLGWVSAGVVALVALRLGAGPALRLVIPAVAGLGIAGQLVLGQGVAIAASALGFWLPSLVLALVLRQRVRLDDTLLTACALGWLLVIGMWVAAGDPVAFWQSWLERAFPPDQWAQRLEVPVSAMQEMFASIAPIMTGLLAAATVLGAIVSLLLGRWLQAELYNPGGFGQEFRALRLGRSAAVIAVGVCALGLFTEVAFLQSLALVAATVYAFQGLAVVHGVVHGAQMGTPWMAALYIALLPLLPYVVTGLIVVGAADAWADYRRRVRPRGSE